jgi:hypothetical protein
MNSKRKYQKLRDSARGEDCTLQIFPYCNQNPETVVLCHISISNNSGMGIKPPDWFGVYGCSDCHDIIDGRKLVGVGMDEKQSLSLTALYRTWERMIEKGLIKI